MPDAVNYAPDQLRAIADSGTGTVSLAGQLMGMLTKDLPDEHWTAATHEGGNHILWTIGHIATSNAQLCGTVGGACAIPEGYEKLFAMGSEPVGDRGAYPAPSEVLGFADRARAALLEAWAGASPEALSKPTEGMLAGAYPTAAHMIHFAGMHEMTHHGQIMQIRRKLGLPRVIG